MFPEFTARTEFPRAAHPGTVTFVGTDGGERVERADSLPDWLKFAPTPDGRLTPVVRVVRVADAHGVCLRSYGADGRLVWVTRSVPPTPPVRLAQPAEPSSVLAAAWDRAPVTAEPTGWF
jgi:FAD/FMN-containing dehydrogenase